MVILHKINAMHLKRIYIEPRLPEALKPLRTMADNVWWSWNSRATALFREMAGAAWETAQYNPIALLDEMSADEAATLIQNEAFMAELKAVYATFEEYMAVKPAAQQPLVAYYCMEYGLHISLKLYSGGLGVLAGDYLKEASDSNVNMVAVGLLYRHGYFQQEISLNGDQINHYPVQLFTKLPVQAVRDANGEWVKIALSYPGRTVYAKLWLLQVGRISLYLLDTDIEENSKEDRALTDALYGGDNEYRLRQEILLGMGGYKALQVLGITPTVYHCNEGHAAFLLLQRVEDIMKRQGLQFDEAVTIVRSSSLFTTHTPVPAGHDNFPETMMRTYFAEFASRLGLSWHDFMAIGRLDAFNPGEPYSVSHLAIRLSQEVNGVSQLHGAVSQKMFVDMFPGYQHEEVHIGYVTNSVHYPTWVAPEWHELHSRLFGPDFLSRQSDPDVWAAINKASDQEIFEIRTTLKKRLLRYVRQKLQADLTRRGESPRFIMEALSQVKSGALVIGFARRFATYKRAHLLFSNLERLSQIINHTDRPVVLLYAGKAHPADTGGQELIRHIVSVSKRPELAGKIIFLEDYNMEMAKLLVQGVDIWLNTPTRPKEASGTSGMKAVMNGVLNFSVLDGWWAEGYRPGAGWSLPLERTYEDQHLQNELDAETIYNMLEEEIVPAYFERNQAGIPEQWVQFIRNNFMEVAPHFTMKRMLDDYYERYYQKLFDRAATMNQATATGLAAWKAKISRVWDQISVVDTDMYDTSNYSLPQGEPFNASITLDLKGLQPDDVGLELVFFKRLNAEELHIQLHQDFVVQHQDHHRVSYACTVQPGIAGVYEYGIRMYPRHELLPHRQDFPLARWV
jgi:glycogen phosphorylase